MKRNDASFRDPDGFVFEREGIVYRRMSDQASRRLSANAKFTDTACEQGLLLPFEWIESSDTDGTRVIRPDQLALVTYPYEWSFEQLRDAALNTLDINILALNHNLTLKDASAFNCQFQKGAMVFIDHTSFEETDGTLPWRPYSQFCRHFLNPLVVGSYRDIHAGGFFRLDLDGLPQQLANDLLPLRACLAPSVLMHMYLHNRYIRRSADFERRAKGESPQGRGRQVDLLGQLRRFIASLKPAKAASAWASYYRHTNYDDATFQRKKEMVAEYFLARNGGSGTLWDIGANDGTFSRLVAPYVESVVALDLDHNAVNANYVRSREDASNIAALVYDIGNPAPALGFQNRERPTLEQRSYPDCILALAIIHHLSITNNIPFDLTAAYFAERSPELVIEFVRPQDSQVQRLLAHKDAAHYGWYNEASFEAAYRERFDVTARQQIEGTHRTLYHLRRRG